MYIDQLSKCDLACFEELKHKGTVHRYPRAAVLCQQGDIGETAYAVVSGVVEMGLVSERGQVRAMSYLARGVFFGHAAGFLGFPAPRAFTVIASTEVEILSIRRDAILAAMSESPEICSYMLKCCALVIYSLMNQIEVGSFGDSVMQVASVLHSLPYNELSGHRQVRASQEEIASMIGKTRVHVARSLSRLQKMGVISMKGKRNVQIEMLDRLEFLAGEGS